MKKPVKIIMLPTEDNTNVGLFENKRLGYIPSMHNNTDWNFVDKNWKRQHLYVTVEQDVEPIKKGDWWIYLGKDLEELKTNDIRQCKTELQQKILLTYDCKKIIATTDFNLRLNSTIRISDENSMDYGKTIFILPKLQQSFLKEYVANPNGNWEVEYEEHKLYAHGLQTFIKLKLNQDNTVNITLVKKPKTKFTYDDITHAIAYGYMARRQGLSYHQCLINYKEANNIKYVEEKNMFTKEEVDKMLFDISNELCWDDKDPEELLENCQNKIKEIKENL